METNDTQDIVTRSESMLKGITPGEWEWEYANGGTLKSGSEVVLIAEHPELIVGSFHDIQFIEASPTLVRELLAEVERLKLFIDNLYALHRISH